MPCFVCEGTGESQAKAEFATHGPDKPGEFYNPHGHYCSHHHPVITEKMHGMFEDSTGQKLTGHFRRIVGGEFARRLIKYTTLNATSLGERIMNRHPESFPPEEFHDTGLNYSHLQGLMFLGFHHVRANDRESDYLVPMFERNGSKFSIFDLGEGHSSDWQGIGRQPLFQKQFGADGIYLGRGIDYFDHPGWGDAQVPTNALGRIETKNRDDEFNLNMGSGPNSAFKKNQFKIKAGKTVCPHCNHHLNTKSVSKPKCYTCGKAPVNCRCKANGKEPMWEDGPEYIEPCKTPMMDSDYADAESEGKCNWPGRTYAPSEKKELVDIKNRVWAFKFFNKDRFAREYLVGRTAQDPPEHVVERMQRERLRERMKAIAKGEADPGLDPKTGKLNTYPERKYILMTDHEGRAVRYPQWQTPPSEAHVINCTSCQGTGQEWEPLVIDGEVMRRDDGSIMRWVRGATCRHCTGKGEFDVPAHRGVPHPMAGQPVYRSVELPVDEPLCAWYKFNAIPMLHGLYDERLGTRMSGKAFCDAFEETIIPYDKNGNPILNKEGEPDIAPEDARSLYQLRYLLDELDHKHDMRITTTGADGASIGRTGQHVRIPVMHAGFGSSLGHHSKVDEDGYAGLTNRQSVLSLVHKVNGKLSISTAKANASGKELLAKIAQVDTNNKYPKVESIGHMNPDTGTWVFNTDFIGFVTSLTARANTNKKLNKGVCKELEDLHTNGSLTKLFSKHALSNRNQRLMLRAPRGHEILSLDEELTAQTITNPDLAKSYLTGMKNGEEMAEPLTKEGANPMLVELVTGNTVMRNRAGPDGKAEVPPKPLREHSLTFGIRPDSYHDALEEHAKEAHNAALQFQAEHFPFQASLEARARGRGVMKIVDGHLRQIPILNAKSHLDVLSDNLKLPQIEPDDDKQWFIHSGHMSTEARKKAEEQAHQEWEGDVYREGYGDTSSYQEQYETGTDSMGRDTGTSDLS
jgi:hypothetical protein